MARDTGDAAEFAFFTMPHASVDCRFAPQQRELQLFGNRAGLLSLANVLLWLSLTHGGASYFPSGN